MAGEAETGGQGQETGTAPGAEGQAPPEPQSPVGDEGGNSPVNPFLEQVNPAHRDIVAPYLSQWDAGVTRKFQELHSTYSPFQQYIEQQVDPASLDQGLQLLNLLETNPQYLYALLQQAAVEEGWGTEGAGEQGLPGQQEGQNGSVQGLPPEMQEQWQQTQEFMQAAASILLNQQQQEVQAQEDAQLEDSLQLWHKEFGDFDEAFVLGRMTLGASIEQAMTDYRNLGKTFLQQQELNGGGPGAAAPRVLSGGSVIPPSGTDVTKLSEKETTNFVADFLRKDNAHAHK